jgi:hypothetical protein
MGDGDDVRGLEPRHARIDEVSAVAELWLVSRRASVPQIPPPAHSDEEVSAWGSRLVRLAKQGRASLDLWTFQSNLRARNFYERHGFAVAASTDGDNEEGMPDFRYHWEPRVIVARRCDA